jgi:hypothetical protein
MMLFSTFIRRNKGAKNFTFFPLFFKIVEKKIDFLLYFEKITTFAPAISKSEH